MIEQYEFSSEIVWPPNQSFDDNAHPCIPREARTISKNPLIDLCPIILLVEITTQKLDDPIWF